ncbi:hypothetical protein BH11MYX1_BH11MYX1_12830 [soil metagenome]
MVKLLLIGLAASTTANPAFCAFGTTADGACILDCIGNGDDRVCLQASPQGPRTLKNLDSTTDCDEIVALGCVIAGTDITIDRHITLRGSRPVIIIATGTLTITEAGIVDANGATDQPGAGGDAACANDATPPASEGMYGGGGAGGSFATRGGDGGSGATALGGRAGAAGEAMGFRAGCNGTDRADGSATTRGVGGFGGGGIYLGAVKAIALSGTVLASGGGGGRAQRGGGGGGGSGGAIVIAAPMLSVATSASVVANGGGGGGGGGGGTDAINGARGATATTIAEPRGGLGAAAGGSGAYAMQPAAAGSAGNDGGGGGGGGGAGSIRVLGGGSLAGAQVSPPPS